MFANVSPMVLVLFTAALALVPTILGLVTSYLKINIILNLLKSGLGTQQVPGPLTTMALSLALTFLIMAPVAQSIFERVDPVVLNEVINKGNIGKAPKLLEAVEPLREFLLNHSGSRELEFLDQLSTKMAGAGRTPPQEEPKLEESSFMRLIPAFTLTELREAFSMGFVLLIPFLVIDLIVANLLVGLGMFMVSPAMISLPLKLLVFTISDGWLLLTKGLATSYMGN